MDQSCPSASPWTVWIVFQPNYSLHQCLYYHYVGLPLRFASLSISKSQVGRNDNNIHGHDTKGSYKEVHQHVRKRLGRNEQFPASMGDSLLFLSFQVWFSKNHIIVVNAPPETQQHATAKWTTRLHHLWF